jgi:SAM-dependent methyltransferase
LKESEIRPPKLFNQYLKLARKDIDRYFSDRSRFVEVSCPACGCDEWAPGMVKFKFRYLLCSDCGSLYLSPRPTVAMYEKFYQEAESVKFWSSHFFKETAEARRQKIFNPLARLVVEWADKSGIPSDAKGVFVDIGSGYGIFLEEVRRLEYFGQIVGIEPEPNFARIGRDRGFDIIEKKLEGIKDYVEIVQNIQHENPEFQLPRFAATIINAPDAVKANFQDFLKANALSSHIRIIGSR